MDSQPWVLTRDEAMWTRIGRAAAAADATVRRAEGADRIGGWRSAALVVIDAACLDEIAAASPPRRDGIVVVAAQPLTAGQWERCVRLGVQSVLGPGGFDAELARLLTDAGDAAARGEGKVIAVLGACGGAGATVLAMAVAIRAQLTGRLALLCDMDPFGAGVDIVAGLEGASGARWGDISVSQAVSRGRLPLDSLYRALPRMPGGRAGAAVLTYRRDDTSPVDRDLEVDIGVAGAVLDAVVRAGDIGVVDLPRAAWPVADRVVARADVTVLVVPADVRGCYAAARVAGGLTDMGTSVGLVVRGPSPGGIGAGDIAATLQLPLLAAMRPQPGLERALDAGRGAAACARGPLRGAASAVLREVGVR